MKSFKALLAVGMSALLAAAFFVSAASAAGSGGAPSASASTACAPATNIEAIIDDSGSMSFTDPDKLRVQAMDLLIETLPTKTTLGAVEFGSGYEGIPGVIEGKPSAYTDFPPEQIGLNKTNMQAALATDIDAEDGATDYNGAFAKADSDNPGSQARIFLTDGGHDEGTYNEAHLAHNVPTYVIGFGGIYGEDEARLKKIAADTGGKVFNLADSSEVQAVVGQIAAALTCQTPPQSFVDELNQGAKSKTHTIAIGAKTHSIQVTLSWAKPGDLFQLIGLKVKSHGQTVAALSRPIHKKPAPKPKKLSVATTASSSTYTVLRIGHLRPGTLSFAVRGAKVASGPVKVTTQVEGAGK